MPPRVFPVPSLRYRFGDPYAPAYLPSIDKEVHAAPPKAPDCSSVVGDVLSVYREKTRYEVKEDICGDLSRVRCSIDHDDVVNDLEVFASDRCRAALPPVVARFIVKKQSLDDDWRLDMKDDELKRWSMSICGDYNGRKSYKKPGLSSLKNSLLYAN